MNIISHQEEVRKIQFSGKSSYIIALPKKWVEGMGLHPGDQVIVSKQPDNSLMITTRGSELTTKNEAVIKVMQGESLSKLIRKIVSAYLLGYNVIQVTTSSGILTSTQKTSIKDLVRTRLVGAEVVADSAQEITIQVLVSFFELSVENALRRMILISSSMHKDAITALEKLDRDLAESVIKTDNEVDRFNLYVIRQLKMAVQKERVLQEIGLTSNRDCLGYRLIVKSVERVADHASKMAQEILMIKTPLDVKVYSELKVLSEFSLKVFEESGIALFKRDYDIADQVVERSKLLNELENEFIRGLEKEGTREVLHTIRPIIEGIRRTAELASDIAEVVLNMTAQKVITAR
ncbi:MAG: PhoU domain-containing protein [Nitrososphaeria archaeon]